MMNNPRIGQLANILTRAEDSGRTDTDAYRAARAEYDALKAAPENISALDVGQRETFGGASRSAIAVSRLT
jgi:hypothetical protein